MQGVTVGLLQQLLKLKSCSNSSSSTISKLKQIHAQLIIRHLPSLSALLLNILIQSYSRIKSPSHSHCPIHLFRQFLFFKNNGIPDKFTFTFLIASCSRRPSPDSGHAAHAQTVKSGFGSDLNVGNSLINFYSVFAQMEDAHKLFDGMPTRDVVSWTSLVKGYTGVQKLDVAQRLFGRMPERNVVSWAVMIAGYVNGEMYADALRLFNFMLTESKEVVPNEAVLVCVLTACAQIGALDQGEWVHAYIDRTKLPKSSNVATALINMYSKCGRIESAKQVFRDASARDVMTWTSMISGLALHGLGNDALQLFRMMADERIRPDSIVLLGVLNACSHSGLVDEGHAIFYDMVRLWRIVPAVEHYGCLIDLLGRAGQLEKALAIIIKMPVEPDIVIWRALLSACRTHGNVELSERIIDHIGRLDIGSQGGGHVLLSNLYASAGRWDEVVRMRNRMGVECRGSSPGCSWIEVDGTVHEFLAADRLHPQINAIRDKLVEVLREVSTKGGYVANTKNVLFDLSDEDQEQAIYWHSEKLAVSFGLMSLEAGCSIRIVKNLRICEDCHSAMKAISRVFSREIIVRDRCRFHTFREGNCSCNDYW